MSENDNLVAGLIRKRAEIAGMIEHTQAQLRQLVIDLDNVDATIRIFRPDIDLSEVKPKPMPPRNQAFKGEVMRLVLGTLRDAKRPMTLVELTRHVMAGRGLSTADMRMLRTMTHRVSSALRHHRGKGLLRSSEGPDKLLLWEIAR